MKKLSIMFILINASLFCQAQILHPVKWAYGAKKLNSKEAVVFIKASIDDGWHIYSVYQKDGGPVPTSFIFPKSADYQVTGSISEPKPVTRFEQAFNMDVSFFEQEVIFRQKIRLLRSPAFVTGSLKFMCCNDHQCLAPETVDFTIPIK